MPLALATERKSKPAFGSHEPLRRSAPSSPSTDASGARAGVPQFLQRKAAPGSSTDVQTKTSAPPTVPATGGPTSPIATPARPPVLWGLDVSVKPPTSYVSVAVPGHSLAEIATYLYGSPEAAASLSSANGSLPEHLPPGKILRPTGAALAPQAMNDFNAGVQQGSILRSKGTPSETLGHEQMIYRFAGGGQTFELTEGQYLGMLRGSATWVRRKAGSLQDTASVYLETQQDHVKNNNSVIRGISDWAGGVDLPDESLYQVPIEQAQQIIDEMTRFEQNLDNMTEVEITPGLAGQIVGALFRLPLLAEKVDRAKNAWHMYIEGTIAGAGSTVHALEITRDVSFGVAAGLAGAVAAPAIFAAAGGGVLGGTLAIGGGAVAGSVTSGTVQFAGAAGGEGLSMAITPGKTRFDWGYVGTQTWSGVKSGAVQGGLGAAGALAAPGLSNVISTRLFGVGTQGLTSTAARLTVNVLTGASLGAPLGGVGSAIENFSAWRSGKITFSQYLGSIGKGVGMGTAAGAAFSLIPIRGLYRTGGQPFNPFSGTPTTPQWMLAAPFSPHETPVARPRMGTVSAGPEGIVEHPVSTPTVETAPSGRGRLPSEFSAEPKVPEAGGGPFPTRELPNALEETEGAAPVSPSDPDVLNVPEEGQAGEALELSDEFGVRRPWEPPPGAAPKPAVDAPQDVRLHWIRERLQMHVDEAIGQYEIEGLTEPQEAAVARRPGLLEAFRGSRIDAFAKDIIMQDPELAEMITAPDFISEPDILSAELPDWFDITTMQQWAAHLTTYGPRYGPAAHLLRTR